ncbi:CG32017 [Drosophila busckii]|uniref:CG32017 n=2 Tax=Drosophila busckii TaxID=30019 RepID=A0A0M4ETA5_DROBS|nr:CG32017 [Drosophila busckii]
MGVPTSSVANMPGNLNSVAVQGSFQKLKELIWTERAKELTQQRRAEELAARAAVLKEIANGQNIQASYKPAFSMHSDSILMDENRTPDRNAIHDERMSIVSDQRFGSNHNKNGHRNIVSTAATIRRIGNSYATGTAFSHKDSGTGAGSIFSLNVNPSNQKTNSRLKIPATELRVDNLSENNQAVIGIPRTYPIRQSYFRERNRSLLKQNSPNDYFQRSIRKLKYQQPVEIEDIMLRDITPGDDIEIITSPLYMDYNNNDPRVTGIRPFPLSTLNTDIYEYNDY